MKKNLLSKIQCPDCKSRLKIKDAKIKNNEYYEGKIICTNCKKEYEIKNYVPRFVDQKNYSESWGELWKNTGKTLRDSDTGATFYYDSIFGKWSETNVNKKGYSPFGFEWEKNLKGKNILEIGPGLGVCTEHLVKTNADLLSVDMSNAIDAFPEQLFINKNLNVIQADINSGIIKENQFDKIWMFQVLQHTPSPLDTLKQIYKLLKSGGEISFTSYGICYHPYRFITKRLSFNSVYKLLEIMLPIKYKLQKIFIKLRLSFIAKLIHLISHPIDPRNLYFDTIEGNKNDWLTGKLYSKTKDKKQLLWYTVVNTFDAITPEYVNGASHEQVRKWTENAGYRDIKIWGKSGVRVKAKK